MSIGAFISGCAGTALGAEEKSFFRRANPWGLILFKRNVEGPAQLKSLTRDFRECVGRADAPVLIDQEGGRVQRLGPPHWPKYPAGARFGELYAKDPLAALAAARAVARLMADDLTSLGINVDCLPVLDVPQEGAHDVIGDRAYARDARIVALIARAVCEGMLAGGVLPVIKHIPGHGRARADSHLSLPVVEAPLAELEATDFFPFAALADAPLAMTAHVVFSAIDPELPATLSPKAISLIRGRLGFSGLLMSDDVSMKALSGRLDALSAKALAAGCDLALHCNGLLSEMEAVAAGSGRLSGASQARAEASLTRLRKPENFDKDQALGWLSRLIPATA